MPCNIIYFLVWKTWTHLFYPKPGIGTLDMTFRRQKFKFRNLPDGFLVVAQAIMSITKEVARLGFALLLKKLSKTFLKLS
jgi:hypothetical protein